jgi:hypothetical protein
LSDSIVEWRSPERTIANQTRKIDVVPEAREPLAFAVIVREGASESRHRMTLTAGEAARFSDHPPPRIIRAAMDFLLDREPKESILPMFDIGVIRRYFPEFDRAFPDYLARVEDSET